MGLSQEFWLQIIIYVISFSFTGGVVWTKLKYMEKKQDKHNKLIERMFVVEESAKSAHKRIDEIQKK